MIYTCIYIYLYIYRYRERERQYLVMPRVSVSEWAAFEPEPRRAQATREERFHLRARCI